MISQPADRLIERVLAKQDGAWQELWELVEPRLFALIRRPRFLARLSQNEDDCRNIVVEVLGALEKDDFARLRMFVAAQRESPKLPFFAWLAVIAKRLAIDYMRRHEAYEDRRGRDDGGPNGAWRIITQLPPPSLLPGARQPVTNRHTALEIISYARRVMPAAQAEALGLWLEGERFEAIAGKLDLSGAREAERLVRAGLERLRHRFREGSL